MAALRIGLVMCTWKDPKNGFSDIATSAYWAITTMTTVGYGDLTPNTDLGRFIAFFTMLVGWGRRRCRPGSLLPR